MKKENQYQLPINFYEKKEEKRYEKMVRSQEEKEALKYHLQALRR